MPELRLYNNRVVMTVFDLLGTKEDDLTYAVGWGLANSDALCRALMSAAFGAVDDSELTGVQLQHSRHGAGRTDIEVNSRLRSPAVGQSDERFGDPWLAGAVALEAPRLSQSRVASA